MDLQPREYQLAATAAAEKANRIVNLPTGSGKTLVAALLHERVVRPNKFSVMAVNSVAIIQQHKSFFESRGITNVIVDTGAALVQKIFPQGEGLTSKLSELDLVIFDECHHALGFHPYVDFAKRCFAENPDIKILGLTASFIHGAFENVKAKKEKLENNLNCTLWVPDEDIAPQDPEKNFFKIDYKQPNSPLTAYDINCRTLELINPALTILNCPFPLAQHVRKEVEKSAYLCYYVLGEAGWSFFLRDGLIPLLDAKMRQKEEYVASGKLNAEGEAPDAAEVQLHLAQMKAERTEYFGPLHKFLQDRVPVIDHVSPKVEALLTTLESCTSVRSKSMMVQQPAMMTGMPPLPAMKQELVYNELDQTLVFVERAVLCIPLAKILELRTKKATKPVMGVQSMDAAERQQTLNLFKHGHVRVLVATASLEEGLDVADCRVVVRFDYFSSVRSHIQGAGRARHKDAKIYYFEQSPEEEQAKAEKLKDVARGKDVEDIAAPIRKDDIPGFGRNTDPSLREQKYMQLEQVGVGHTWGAEETAWDHVANKSMRVIKCKFCGAFVKIASKAFGRGRKQKERSYFFKPSPGGPWICPTSSQSAISQATAEGRLAPPDPTTPREGEGDNPAGESNENGAAAPTNDAPQPSKLPPGLEL